VKRITSRASLQKLPGSPRRKHTHDNIIHAAILNERRGNSDLEEPIAIRPTSETAMYPCE
jgi:hypothetical protein